MIKEFKIRLLMDDEGGIISVNTHGDAVTLRGKVLTAATVLIEFTHPKMQPELVVTTSKRTRELANGRIEDGKYRYKMYADLSSILSVMAQISDPMSPKDVMTLTGKKQNTITSAISRLYINGMLTKEGIGKYMVSPVGQSWLASNSIQEEKENG